MNNTVIAVLIVLAIVLVFTYQYEWLNKFLPASWQKQTFVGAYGRTPGMQNCLAFGNDGQRWPFFNRCTYA